MTPNIKKFTERNFDGKKARLLVVQTRWTTNSESSASNPQPELPSHLNFFRSDQTAMIISLLKIVSLNPVHVMIETEIQSVQVNPDISATEFH